MAEENHTPLLVRDLMKVGVATCAPDTLVIEIARLLVEKGLEAIIVLDPEDGHAIGMVSQEELVQVYGRSGDRPQTAEDILREDIPTAPPDIPVQAAAQIMLDRRVRVLFMMHHAGGVIYPAAFLSFSHLIRHLAARNGEELKDLGIQAERQSPLDAFIQRREAARRARGGKL